MSSSIWTRSAASSEIRPLVADPWRVVEAQHRISTRKLVASDREQFLLEQMIDAAKPPAPDAGLHYLLFTPFRYPPLRRGSRFGARRERGIWYGSDAPRTAFAEVAYYRLLFIDGTDADLGTLETDLTAFRAPVAAERAIDLSTPAFARWRSQLASKTSYAATQPFGDAMREADVQAFRYVSARDDQAGTNIGLFTPRAFAARRPRTIETWHSTASVSGVDFAKLDYFDRRSYRFEREAFLVRGALPRPALAAD